MGGRANAKSGRITARAIQDKVRKYQRYELIVNHGFDNACVDRPISLRGIKRIMEEFPDVVRGDGSRRRAAEVRRGFHAYRTWLSGDDEASRGFATYLFDGDEWPDIAGLDVDWSHVAYMPPNLTTNYERAYGLMTTPFEWGDDGGRSRAALKGAQFDRFGKHRRWQDLIGEKSPNHKLTEEKVVAIRERYAAGGISMAALAKEYGVSQATISGIVWGDLWIYAPGPVKCRQVMRARCTASEPTYNHYGERTRTEDHPRPDILTSEEQATLDALEERREEDRYVSFEERRAWNGKLPIEYEWGVFDPKKQDKSNVAIIRTHRVATSDELIAELQLFEDRHVGLSVRAKAQVCFATNKIRHKSKNDAEFHREALVARVAERHPERVESYKCKTCGDWHVGHKV
jgi:hypothetical protein